VDRDPKLTTAADAERRDEDLLTEQQAQQQELPLSLSWFQRHRWLGDGPPYVRVGNRIFYIRGELRRWIAAHLVVGDK
jgi:hypothetical protein